MGMSTKRKHKLLHHHRLSQFFQSTALPHKISRQVLSSQSIVLSSKTVRPCNPWGGWIGHWRKTWSTIWFSAPHSSRRSGHTPFVQTGAKTSHTGAEAANQPRAPHICYCQINWWVVVQLVQTGVPIWGAVHSMDRWTLSGTDIQPPWHDVLETVWFQRDEAQQVGCLRG